MEHPSVLFLFDLTYSMKKYLQKMKSQADHSLDQELQTGSKQVQNLYIVCKDSGGQRTMMLGSCISLRGFLI